MTANSIDFETHPAYLVIEDYGHRGFEGICHPELNKANIIDRIATGEYSDRPFQIFELFEGKCRDVTATLVDAAENAR